MSAETDFFDLQQAVESFIIAAATGSRAAERKAYINMIHVAKLEGYIDEEACS